MHLFSAGSRVLTASYADCALHGSAVWAQFAICHIGCLRIAVSLYHLLLACCPGFLNSSHLFDAFRLCNCPGRLWAGVDYAGSVDSAMSWAVKLRTQLSTVACGVESDNGTL